MSPFCIFNPPSTDDRRETASKAHFFDLIRKWPKIGLYSFVHYAIVAAEMTVRAVAAKDVTPESSRLQSTVRAMHRPRNLPLAAKLQKTRSTGPFWPRGPLRTVRDTLESRSPRLAPVLRAVFERRPSGPIISFFSLHKTKTLSNKYA
jgi:hypothetical protein